MSLKVSDRDNEWLNTVVSFESNAACEDHSMCGLDTQVTWPEFRGLEVRRMQHEFVSARIKLRCRLEASDVRAMTKLGLSVAPDDLPVVNQRHVVTNLLFAAKLADRLSEHLHV